MSGFQDHVFVTQFAIRLPNQELYGCRTYNPQDMMSGWIGMGMAQGFGGFEGDEDLDEEITTPPTVWYDRKEVERGLEVLRQQAKTMGIEYWGGQIVERLCSPFTGENLEGYVDEIQTWLKEQ